MNKRLLKYELSGFIITAIAGTLLHFVYDRSGQNKFIAIFAPVNESPWEHLKLLYFPFLIFTLILIWKMRKEKDNVAFANYVGIIAGMLSTLGYFYTLNGAIGGNNTWVNLSSYFFGLAIAFIISYIITSNTIGDSAYNAISGVLFVAGILLFVLFTFSPPQIPLFQDPINLNYGV